jgi:LytR cell envelope-related transcriptional attenuator
LPEIVQEIGAAAGLAAVAGLAVLSVLYFSQARDLKRLREWAGRAPERSAELGTQVIPGRAPTPAGAVQPGAAQAGAPKPAQPAPAQQAAKPGQPAPAQQAAKPGQPAPAAQAPGATPADADGDAAETADAGVAKPEEAKPGQPQPATAAGQAAKPQPGQPRPAAPAQDPSDEGDQEAAATQDRSEEAQEADQEAASPKVPAGAMAASAGATAASATQTKPPQPQPAPGGGNAGAAAPGPAAPSAPGGPGGPSTPAGGRPAGVPPPVPAGQRQPGAPAQRQPGAPAQRPASGQRVPVRPMLPARPMPSQQTAIIPPPRQPWYRRLLASPRYLVLAVAGVLVFGGAAAFGVASLTGGDSGGSGAKESGAVSSRSGADESSGDSQKASPPAVDPGKVTVAVLNGTTVPGLAKQVGDQVSAKGFHLGTVANTADQDQQRAESVVLYSPGHKTEARVVSRRLQIIQRQPIDPASQQLAGDATVVVIAGADLSQ